jgi:hypothetical protein
LTASSQDLAAASLHCNKNKLARSTTIINQNPPKICAVQNYSWIQLSQAVLRRFSERLCAAIGQGRDKDFPAENDFFACVEIVMSEYCPHKLHMVGYCVVWLILVDKQIADLCIPRAHFKRLFEFRRTVGE